MTRTIGPLRISTFISAPSAETPFSLFLTALGRRAPRECQVFPRMLSYLLARNRRFGRWRRKMMLGDAPPFGTTRQNQRRAQYSVCGAAGIEVEVELSIALGKIDTFPQFAQFLIDQCEPGGSKRADVRGQNIHAPSHGPLHVQDARHKTPHPRYRVQLALRSPNLALPRSSRAQPRAMPSRPPTVLSNPALSFPSASRLDLPNWATMDHEPTLKSTLN